MKLKIKTRNLNIIVIGILILFMNSNVLAVSEPNWSTGLEIGMYKTDLVLEQTIVANGDPAGTLIDQTITSISDDYIGFSQITMRPDENPFGSDILHERVGFKVLTDSGRTPVLATTNTTYLQEFLITNSSGNLKFSINHTHFKIDDHFFMAAHSGYPDHYLTYNGTFDISTGWRIEAQIAMGIEGEIFGRVRLTTIETGLFPQKTDPDLLNSADSSSISLGLTAFALITLTIHKRKNLV